MPTVSRNNQNLMLLKAFGMHGRDQKRQVGHVNMYIWSEVYSFGSTSWLIPCLICAIVLVTFVDHWQCLGYFRFYTTVVISNCSFYVLELIFISV